MGYQIIKQPEDGWFAIFDHGADTFAAWNATADEVVSWFRERAEERARKMVADAIADTHQRIEWVRDGQQRKAYFQFAKTWEQAVAADAAHDGDYTREQGC